MTKLVAAVSDVNRDIIIVCIDRVVVSFLLILYMFVIFFNGG